MHTADATTVAPDLSVTRSPGGAPRLMRNVVQPYDWGSRTRLALLQGRVPDGRTEAELWMGAHPLAPSRLCDVDGRETCLAEEIAADPLRTLGPDVLDRFGPRLPFLLKILAIDRALSVQVHPDARQAAEGFAREVADDVPPGRRRFTDPYPKPELLVAVTHVEALAGWRDAAASAALLGRLAAAAGGRGRLGDVRDRVAAAGVVAGLTALAGWPAGDRDGLVAEVARGLPGALADAAGEDDADEEHGSGARAALVQVGRLLEQHPGDPLVVAPLLLDLVVLAPGTGLYVPAGVPHAYLAGLGVEIMCASDNVVRAGLTSKAVDVPLLLDLLDPAAAPLVEEPGPVSAHEALWAPPAREFRLTRLRVDGGPVAPAALPGAADGPQILLCLTGAVTVSSGAHHVDVRAGESVFLGADVGDVRVAGTGEVYRACVGDPAHG